MIVAERSLTGGQRLYRFRWAFVCLSVCLFSTHSLSRGTSTGLSTRPDKSFKLPPPFVSAWLCGLCGKIIMPSATDRTSRVAIAKALNDPACGSFSRLDCSVGRAIRIVSFTPPFAVDAAAATAALVSNNKRGHTAAL